LQHYCEGVGRLNQSLEGVSCECLEFMKNCTSNTFDFIHKDFKTLKHDNLGGGPFSTLNQVEGLCFALFAQS